MADIRHRVGIDAPRQTVYGKFATAEGLATWWTRTLDGDSRPGGKLRFFFDGPEPAAVMEVLETRAPEAVRWRCVEGPDAWVGTELSFELHEAGDGDTIVLFQHAGWREPAEFMSHCSTKWAYFLLTVKNGLEGGELTPYPDDLHLSKAWP